MVPRRRDGQASSSELVSALRGGADGSAAGPVHRVLAITLDRQPARRERFLEQLSRWPGLVERLEWIRAVDGVGLDLTRVSRAVVSEEGLADAQTPREKVVGYVLTRGAVGLACSLHSALSLIARDTDEGHVYLLCEDDATFRPDFAEAFEDLLASAARHDPMWEVLHLGYHPGHTTVGACSKAVAQCPDARGGAGCGLGVPEELFGTYGLALPPRGARALLGRLFPVSLQVDTELSRAYRHLARARGDTQTRAESSARASGARLRVLAPRCAAGFGPLIVAPASRPESTDIQVMSQGNFEQQYPA